MVRQLGFSQELCELIVLKVKTSLTPISKFSWYSFKSLIVAFTIGVGLQGSKGYPWLQVKLAVIYGNMASAT
jgi:hypothetical protein